MCGAAVVGKSRSSENIEKISVAIRAHAVLALASDLADRTQATRTLHRGCQIKKNCAFVCVLCFVRDLALISDQMKHIWMLLRCNYYSVNSKRALLVRLCVFVRVIHPSIIAHSTHTSGEIRTMQRSSDVCVYNCIV